MEEKKKKILKSFLPRAALVPITEQAEQAISNEKIIPLRYFPFNIGRESRMGKSPVGFFVKLRIMEDNDKEVDNDIYLIDTCKPLQISKEHCKISFKDDIFTIKDRGSATGTLLNGVSISITEEELKDGDIIQIGSEESEYKFEFLTFDI